MDPETLALMKAMGLSIYNQSNPYAPDADATPNIGQVPLPMPPPRTMSPQGPLLPGDQGPAFPPQPGPAGPPMPPAPQGLSGQGPPLPSRGGPLAPNPGPPLPRAPLGVNPNAPGPPMPRFQSPTAGNYVNNLGAAMAMQQGMQAAGAPYRAAAQQQLFEHQNKMQQGVLDAERYRTDALSAEALSKMMGFPVSPEQLHGRTDMKFGLDATGNPTSSLQVTGAGGLGLAGTPYANASDPEAMAKALFGDKLNSMVKAKISPSSESEALGQLMGAIPGMASGNLGSAASAATGASQIGDDILKAKQVALPGAIEQMTPTLRPETVEDKRLANLMKIGQLEAANRLTQEEARNKTALEVARIQAGMHGNTALQDKIDKAALEGHPLSGDAIGHLIEGHAAGRALLGGDSAALPRAQQSGENIASDMSIQGIIDLMGASKSPDAQAIADAITNQPLLAKGDAMALLAKHLKTAPTLGGEPALREALEKVAINSAISAQGQRYNPMTPLEPVPGVHFIPTPKEHWWEGEGPSGYTTQFGEGSPNDLWRSRPAFSIGGLGGGGAPAAPSREEAAKLKQRAASASALLKALYAGEPGTP